MRVVSLILFIFLGALLLPVESQHLVKYSHNYSQYNSSGVTSLACHNKGTTCSACSELGGGCGWCQKTQTCGYKEDCQGEWSSSETSCLYEHLFGVIVILVVMFVVILIILLVFFILLLIDQVVKLLQKKPKAKVQNKKVHKGVGSGLEACSDHCWCSDAYSNLDKGSSIPSRTFRRLSGAKPSQIVSPLPRTVEATKIESRGGTPSSRKSSPTPNQSSQRSSPLPTPVSRRSSPLPRISEHDTPKLLRKDNKIIEKLPDIPLDQESKSTHVPGLEDVHQAPPTEFKQPRSFTMLSRTHSLEHRKENTHEPLPPPRDTSLQETEPNPPSLPPKQPRIVPKKSHKRQTELHSFHVPVYSNAFVKTVSCQVPTETMVRAEKEPKMTTSTSTSSLEEILTSPDSLQSMKFMIEPTDALLDYIKSPENQYSSGNYSDSVSSTHVNPKLNEAVRSSMESLSSHPTSRWNCGISSPINSKSTNTNPYSPVSSRTIHSNLSSPMSSRRNSVIHSPVISRKTPSPSSPNVLTNNSNPSSPIMSRKPPLPSSPVVPRHKCDISSSMVSKSTSTDQPSDQTSPPSSISNIRFSIPLSSRDTHHNPPSNRKVASESQGALDGYSTMTSTRTNSEIYIPFSNTDSSLPMGSPLSSGRNTSMSGQLVFSAGRDGVAVAEGNAGAACQSSILQVDNNQFYLVVQINLQGNSKEQQIESTESIDKLKSDEFDKSTIVLRNDKTFTKKSHLERPHSIYCSKQSKPFVDNKPEVKPKDYKRKLRTLQRLSSLSPRNKSNNIQKIVDSFMKLTLLKILFIDIGLSLGDSITDFLQGINLLWDYNSSTFHQATFYYGIAVLSTKWLPSILVMSHCWFSSESQFLTSKGSLKVSIIIFLVIFFFPIVPTVLYVKILFSRRKSLEDRKRVQMLEQQAHEMRSITSAVESPIQVIILVWLMLRGILTIPIESSLSFFCVEDDLGRMACLPSIPIASLLFSGLSIIKSVFNLNLYPLFIPLNSGINSLKLCVELFLRFTPFFFVNALFRICSYAFILVYIDYWFTIPGVILFMINYIFYSISFTRFNSSSLLEPSRPDVCGGHGANQLNPGDKTMAKYKKRRSFYQYWQKSDMEQENIVNETRKKNFYGDNKSETVTLRNPSTYHRLYSFVDSIYATVTPNYVNEENTSIFLNSVTGMFLPSCHTHLNGRDLSSFGTTNPRIGKVVGWQKKIFRKQVITFNLLLFLIIIVIYFLVTQTSFNYISNILDPLWFHIVIVFLGVMWILTIILTLEPDCVKLMAGIKHCFRRKKSSDSSKMALHQLYMTYTNGRESHSGNEKKQYFIKKACICAFIFIIIVIPLVLTILLFPKIKSAKPYIFFLKEGHTASFDVNFIILGTFPISQINFSNKLVISGELDTSCQIDQDKDFTSSVFVISSTNQTCVNLAKQDDFFDIMSKSDVKAVIFLDNTPQSHWRVSSNYNRIQSLRGPVPVLGVRLEDWKRASGQFSHGKSVHISMGDYTDIDMASKLTCTNSSSILIGNSFPTNKDKHQDLCSVRDDPTHNPESQKHLLVNGSISEHFCLRSECWDLGQSCPENFFQNIRQLPLTLQCPNSLNNRLSFEKAVDGTTLKPIMISGSTGWSDYCCQQSEFGTSTFLEVLGEGCFTRWRDVVNFRDKCGFTRYVKEECVRGQQKVWRVCNAMGGCVIREYFSTYCGKDEALGLCSRSDTTCY